MPKADRAADQDANWLDRRGMWPCAIGATRDRLAYRRTGCAVALGERPSHENPPALCSASPTAARNRFGFRERRRPAEARSTNSTPAAANGAKGLVHGQRFDRPERDDAVKRVPAAMNLDFMPDTGRMNGLSP